MTLYFFIALLLSSVFGLQAQDVTQLSRGTFTNGNSVGKLHTFGDQFQNDEKCRKLFNRFNRARVAHKVVNFTTIGLTGAFVVAGTIISLDNNDVSSTIDNEDLGAVLIVSGLASGISILGLGSLITVPIKNYRKNKLLSSCRESEMGLSYVPKLKVVVSVNGVGLAYQL